MNTIEVLFLSIVQGVSEWLPISSSGHLVLFEEWLNISSASLSFDIFLHLASLIVIILFFRKQIVEIIKAPQRRDKSEKSNWWWYVIISSFFTAIIGYFLYQRIDFFRESYSVANWLVVTSLFLLATYFSTETKNINWKHAVILGIAQGIAVLPGLSRSGLVISLALIMKVKKNQAFEYGFIVVIPAIIGSFLLTIKDFNFSYLYFLGFIVTIIVSYLTLILLKLIIKKKNLYLFAIYTAGLALIIKLL